MAKSWLTVALERIGTNISSKEYSELVGGMCVIRSFGSVVGQTPDISDNVVRMEQMILKTTPGEDIKQVSQLPGELSSRNTPLGVRLRDYDVETAKLDIGGIEKAVFEGSEVVLIGRRVVNGKTGKLHAMHVRPDFHGRVDSVSDQGSGISFEVEEPVDAIIFKKRT